MPVTAMQGDLAVGDTRVGLGPNSAEVLQLYLVLRHELDGIRGQRSWHKDSPPDQAKVGRTVICQDLAHVKPTGYLLRTVLGRSILYSLLTPTLNFAEIRIRPAPRSRAARPQPL